MSAAGRAVRLSSSPPDDGDGAEDGVLFALEALGRRGDSGGLDDLDNERRNPLRPAPSGHALRPEETWLPQVGGVLCTSAPGIFQGLSVLSEGLPRDFPPPNAASPRKTGKGLRRRSEALSEAKPQVGADESGCTPGSVPRDLAVVGATAIHLRPALPPASCGLPADSGEQPSNIRAGTPRCPLLTLLRVGFT